MNVFNPFCKSRKLMREGGVGYTETENKTLCSVALQYMSDLNASVGTVTELINLTESENYNVKLDSGSYIAKCKLFNEVAPYLGNLALMGIGEDTGETFLVFVGEDTTIVDKNLGTSATISQETETIHPIDPKYLPSGSGGGLPVVELTTVPTAEGVALTAEENAKMDEVVAVGMPIILKVALTDSVYVALCHAMGQPNSQIMAFIADVAGMMIQILNTGNGWLAIASDLSA